MLIAEIEMSAQNTKQKNGVALHGVGCGVVLVEHSSGDRKYFSFQQANKSKASQNPQYNNNNY
jgi:hypothetical protein